MRSRSPLAHLPLVIGIVLSIVAHAAALYFRGEGEPARLELETGRTVVQLTLIPSMAAHPAEPAPTIVEPAPTIVEPAPELEPKPIVEAEPIPAPLPEPIAEPTPNPPVEPASEPTAEPAAVESVEQLASEIAEKGVEIEAAPVSQIQPKYPRSAQKRGQEGTVLLSIKVRANGTAGEVMIIESSGYKVLDAAAVKAAEQARYTPATNRGRAVDSELIQPITFQLD